MAGVFVEGKFSVHPPMKVEACSKSLVVISPTDAGKYPVVMLIHGYALGNSDYEILMNYIASHGYILVAPQLTALLPNSTADVDGAAEIANWLTSDNHFPPHLLPEVEPDFKYLVLAGHSRGGHAAFSVAMGLSEPRAAVPFSALIGIDPVAGPCKSVQIPPKILTYEPNSFNLDIPTLVIGTGLGPQPKFPPLPAACAPERVNHVDFYYECKPTSYHFVVSEFGHVDMLDDKALPNAYRCVCTNGKKDCRDVMRRTTAGLVVAFLEAHCGGKSDDLSAILKDPGIAPTRLDPVEWKKSDDLSAIQKDPGSAPTPLHPVEWK